MPDETLSRRQLLRVLGAAAVGAPFAAALGQGRCRLRLGAVGCDTTAIKPLFDATGWKTLSLDHRHVRRRLSEAAFYTALRLKLRSDDGTRP